MSTAATPPIQGEYTLAAPPFIPAVAARPSASRRALVAPVKFLVGMALTQSFLGSLMVVGWTYRLAQRCILKYWWARSGHAANGGRFEEFLAAQTQILDHSHWPNWLLQQNFRRALHATRERVLQPTSDNSPVLLSFR